MAPVEDAPADAGGADAVKPYNIRVSSRYIDLTRQKLELARLPHEGLVTQSSSWWEPKAEVESLIDFWLEQYSWRAQEDAFNNQLAQTQFRTGFPNPAADPDAPALRLHFVHVRSSRPDAVPLLLVPPFPFTNVSLVHLIEPLVNPSADGDASSQQAFHLVIPSLPGLGFSDALPNNVPAISSTADILNSLMLRLGYDHYLVTNAAPGTVSPAHIDHKLVDFLASCYSAHCLGAHLIAPPLLQPTLKQNPVEWAKWSVASMLRRDLFGYKPQDFSRKARFWPVKQANSQPASTNPLSLHALGLKEPNTLAYALCDSPTGLLVQVIKNLRTVGPSKEFTQTEILNFTQLSWLPGPEAALRYWASCSQNPEIVRSTQASKPRVTMTVFQDTDSTTTPNAVSSTADNEAAPVAATTAFKGAPLVPSYTCPAWANHKYQVLHITRAAGVPGLLAWERPEVIADGARKLAASILKLDKRLRARGSDVTTAPLAGVAVDGDQCTAPSSSAGSRTANGSTTAAPPPLTQSPSGHLAPPARLSADQRVHPQREVSDDTVVSNGSGAQELSPEAAKKLSIDERIRPTRQLSDETAVSGRTGIISVAGSGTISPAAPTTISSVGSLPSTPSAPAASPAPQQQAVAADKADEPVPAAAIVVTSEEDDTTTTTTQAPQKTTEPKP